MAQLEFEILASVDKATSAIQSFEKAANKSLTGIEKNVSKTNLAFSSFIGNLGANIATKGLSLAGDAIGSIVNLISNDAIENSQSYADAILGVQNALELTGKATPEAIKGLDDFAQQIQATTKFGDDAVLSAAAYIQTLGRLDGEGLQRATKAALDLSAALGKDLSTTQELVAKAAAGNVSAFGKLGIRLEKGKTDAETFEKALAALEARFGGSAEKSVNSYSGAIAQLSNAFSSNLLKTIGDLIVQSPAVVGAIKGITKIINDFTAILSKQTSGKDFFRDIINGAIDFARAINDFVIRPLAFLGDIGLAVFNLIRLGLNNSVVAAGTLGAAIAQTLNVVGVVSDETAQKFTDFRDSAIATSRDFASQVGDNLKSAFTTSEIADGIDSAISTISTSVANQLTALPAIANNVGVEVKEALVLSDATIEIGLKIGDPTAIQAALDKSKQIQLDAQTQLGLNQVENQALLNELKEVQELEFIQRITDARLKSETDRFTAVSDNQFALLDLQARVIDEQLANENLTVIQKAALEKRKTDIEKQQLNARLKLSSDFFSGLQTLAQGENRELFELAKAANLANAIVSTASAVTNALAVPPFPVGLALAAVAAVQGAVQIKTIQAQKFQKGITEIPGGFPNDSFPALLTSGERVVDSQTNQDLKAFLNAGNDTGPDGESQSDAVVGILGQILQAIQGQSGEIVVNIGGREIIREVRDGLRAGGSLAI